MFLNYKKIIKIIIDCYKFIINNFVPIWTKNMYKHLWIYKYFTTNLTCRDEFDEFDQNLTSNACKSKIVPIL